LQNEQNIFLAVLLEGGGMHSARQFRVPEALHSIAVVFQIVDVTFPSITAYSFWSEVFEKKNLFGASVHE